MVRSARSFSVALVLSILAAAPVAADELCAALDQVASGWDEMATAIDGALDEGISDADAVSLDDSIAEAVGGTREMADAFGQTEGLDHWGRTIEKSLRAIEAAEDFADVVRWVDRLVETLDAMIEECQSAGPATSPAPAPTRTQPPAPTRTQPPAPTRTQPPAPTRTQPPAPTRTQPPAPTRTQPPAPAGVSSGSFRFVYEPAPNADLAELAGILQQSGVYEELAAIVHSTIALPVDIPVVFTSCGVPNAFYQPDVQRVVMCYEFFEFFVESLAGSVPDDEIGVAILGVGGFFLMHEFGHALVHVLDLPITGREEDAVDQLAALMLLDTDEEGEAAVLSAVTQFEGSAALLEQNSAALSFWDEHSLDAQRMYDLACLLYGSDPEAYAGFVGPDLLPAERAARCPAEFAQKYDAWSRILAPYMFAQE